ncbi:MAG: hypothetical protein HYW51_03395 [Candidatus Doudnabacteria bacterium]|nr:hypothetical protein [Candidatus Doudnabacteria bacterium]
MDLQKNLFHGFLSAVGVFVYTSVVAWLLFNSGRLFGTEDTFWGPVGMLLLFVLSATLVGLMVLGRPAYLFLNGRRFEALKLLFMTISWLAVIVIIVLAFQLS